MKNNTYGIKEHARKRNQETLEKVDNAIKRLKRSKTKNINFKTVAEEAGIATATLYNNLQLKERIESLRALQKAEKDAEKQGKKKSKYQDVEEVILTPTQAKIKKMKAMHEEIKKLKEDKKNLIIQLVEMEELKAENKKLREQIKKVITIKNENIF